MGNNPPSTGKHSAVISQNNSIIPLNNKDVIARSKQQKEESKIGEKKVNNRRPTHVTEEDNSLNTRTEGTRTRDINNNGTDTAFINYDGNQSMIKEQSNRSSHIKE
jgi:hypothetical protein